MAQTAQIQPDQGLLDAPTVTNIPTTKQPDARKNLIDILRDPVWQGLGGVVGLVAFGWAIYTFFYSAGSGSETPTPTYTVTLIAAVSTATSALTPTPAQTPTNTSMLATDTPSHTFTPQPTPTPIPHYPPPSPAPGVPPGPLQQEMDEEASPVCDAAEYLDPYVPDNIKRILIVEDDDVAVKAPVGSTVYRAWRLRNMGTCVWGPGYELAFYGGQKMGSDGVIFENPDDDTITNYLVESDHLIVPEGNPGQVAVLEVKLKVPNTPGIAQSYWRLRNPGGEYFGPVVGITINVVRECQFGIYGAPIIDPFVILIAGDVYMPNDPIHSAITLGESVTLRWKVINAIEFKIDIEDPNGKRHFIDTEELEFSDELTLSHEELGKLGRYMVRLRAYNGNCTVLQEVSLDVFPR